MDKMITVGLSNPIIAMYGNPLQLEEGELREVVADKLVMDLLRNGALVSSNIGSSKKITPKKQSVKADVKDVTVKQNKLIQNTAKATTNTANSTKKANIQFNIKGVGKETLKDINTIYDNEKQLIDAIEADKVPLRNDVVKKIRDYYNKLVKR